MRTSASEVRHPSAVRVRVHREAVIIDLRDGRTVAAPLAWYPRLLNGTPRERRNWRLIGGGAGIQWPDLDEDLSVEGILAGRPSTESRTSLAKWMSGRKAHGRAARVVLRTSSSRRRARG